ncbi:MAG: non-homologous end-joining DNA ligase [Candidatus Nanopelagicales bacterium]
MPRDLIKPMLATAGDLPPSAEDPLWAYEMKWDGVRAVTYVEGGHAHLFTRNDRDVTVSYPEVAEALSALGVEDAVLDGEVVALGPEGRPSFGRLQNRMHVASPAAVRRLREQLPVVWFGFDLLELGPRSLLDLPYEARRELLEDLDISSTAATVPPAFVGVGSDAVAASKEQGLEGIVAKQRSSTYSPGRRTQTWIKVKNIHMQEVVVGGWRPGQGRRGGGIGSLLMGVPGPDGMLYVGHVGTGFDDAALDRLEAMLRPLVRATSPFANELPREASRDAVWVEPEVVGEVAYGEWTRDSRLRHPVWRGLRPDKSPSDVTRE